MASGMHEQFDKRDDVKAPSERSFGITFAVVFALLAAFSYWHRGAGTTFYVTIAVSMVFAVVTLMAPRILRPLNLIWLKFGLLLHKVVNPVIMGILFFGIFTPMGVVMRMFGVDFLRMKRKPATESYWIAKSDDAIPDSSMKNQF
jgi:saxitoxin biosynthesis operon SxtJ-like protein